MMSKSYKLEFIQAEQRYTIQDVCQRIQLDKQFVVQCVEYGITELEIQQDQDWLFTTMDILKLQKAYRLQRDLEINFSSIGIILNLLEDIDELHEQVNQLQQKLEHWEKHQN